MFAETKKIKKYTAIPAVLISAIFTSILFWQFGSSWWSSPLWLLAGLTIQSYQIICLLEYLNSRVRKKKNIVALMKYLIITFFSVLASVSFGVMDIEKQTYNSIDNISETTKISLLIEEKEKLLNQDNSAEIELIKKQIAKSTTPNTQNTELMISRISQLKNQDNNILIEEIAALKKKKLQLESESSSSVEAFGIIAGIFGASEKVIRIIFLAMMSLIIEMIVYGTTASGFQQNTTQKKTARKKKDSGQLMFIA